MTWIPKLIDENGRLKQWDDLLNELAEGHADVAPDLLIKKMRIEYEIQEKGLEKADGYIKEFIAKLEGKGGVEN